MIDKQIIAGIGLGVSFISYLIYFHGIWRGRVKPHAFTWLVWGTLTAIACAAQITERAGPGFWVLAMATVACFLIFSIGFLQKEKDIARSDMAALVLALASIPIWLATDTPLWSVLIVSAINAVGAFPTIRKSWSKPGTESVAYFVLSGAAMLFGIAALDVYSLTTVLYPAIIAVVNGAIVFVVLLRRKRMS